MNLKNKTWERFCLLHKERFMNKLVVSATIGFAVSRLNKFIRGITHYFGISSSTARGVGVGRGDRT